MKNFIATLSFGLIACTTFSQQVDCGTPITNENVDYLEQMNVRWTDRVVNEKAYGGTTFYVPVQLHIIRDNSGSGGITEADCLRAFDRLNRFYIDASVHYFQIEPINYIDDDNYFDYDKSQMNDLDADHAVSDVLNIYIANSVTSSGSAICGHAQFPGGLDFVMQSVSCMKNGSTLSHEVGHYMGLYHTHETSFGDEAVDGSDCLNDGDLLCDTPADPRLSGGSNFTSTGCDYYGTDLDENAELYDPMVTNVMSYASKECRVEFTEDQFVRILWTLENERAYLDWPMVLVDVDANFYVKPNDDCYNVTAVEFFNASEAADSYLWDFGDGVGTSTSESPSYIYGASGAYDVTLTATDFIGITSTYTQNVVVGAVSLPYLNDFDNGSDDLNDFRIANRWKNQVTTNADAAESGAFGMVIDGTEFSSTSPSFITPNSSTAFDDLHNPYYKSVASICVNGTGYTDLVMDFDKRQLRTSNDNYTNLRVTVNGTQIGNVIYVESSNTDDPGFTNYSFDLSAYDGTVFTVALEGSHKYNLDFNGVNTGTATMIDNLSIDGVFDASQASIDEMDAATITAYPNPFSDQILISAQTTIDANPTVFELGGKELTSQVNVVRMSSSSFSCDMTNLASGIYLISVGQQVIRVVKK